MPYPSRFVTASEVWASVGMGWGYWSDSVHTSESPQSISAGTRTQFSVDGLGATTELGHLDTLTSSAWSSNQINPSDVGESYSCRVDLIAVPSTVSQNEYIELELDIGGGSQINIVEKRLPLQKGAGSEHKFAESINIFCLSTFNANGGRIFLTPTVPVTVYKKAIFIRRDYRP